MPKRKRSNHGDVSQNKNNESYDNNGKKAFDLMVLMPKEIGRKHNKLLLKEILKRLEDSGFTHAALTHRIYGRIREEDGITTVFEDSGEESGDVKRISSAKSGLRTLRRIHAVLENLSDVSMFTNNSDQKQLLKAYDIRSVAPQNESTFQSVCTSATLAEIVTLDYSSGRGYRLPYKIRPTDVDAIIARKGSFEIPLAPALLNPKYRKALVQTCRELQMASLGKRVPVIFSSGDRSFEDTDVGAMAFRAPDDVINLITSVCQFGPSMATEAVRNTAAGILQQGRENCFGSSCVADVYKGTIPMKDDTRASAHVSNDSSSKKIELSGTHTIDDNSPDGLEDGFISMD